jgi:hypothetical protein
MEGYLLKKTDQGVLSMKRYVRKYVVVDHKDETISIFPRQPPTDEEFEQAKDKDDYAKVECKLTYLQLL